MWDRKALTLAALYFHPSLEVARAEWSAANAGKTTAGARPNPSLALQPGRYLNSLSGAPPWFGVFDFDVPIETAGKRGYRIDIARSEAEAARLRVAEVAWAVCSDVRNTLVRLQGSREREGLARDAVAIHARIVGLLEHRLAAGAIEGVELRNARIAWTKANIALESAVRDRELALSDLAAALGVPLAALKEVTIASELGELPSAFFSLTAEHARDEAVTSRPDIRAALADYAGRQAALQLEIAKQYPDVHIGTGYEYDQGDHKWSLGLSLELPLLNRNEGPIAEAEAARAESRARFLELQARVMAAVEHAATARAAAERQLADVERLDAAEAASLESMRRSFDVGASDRLDVANAELEANQARSARLDADLALREVYGLYEDVLQHPLVDWAGDLVVSQAETGLPR